MDVNATLGTDWIRARLQRLSHNHWLRQCCFGFRNQCARQIATHGDIGDSEANQIIDFSSGIILGGIQKVEAPFDGWWLNCVWLSCRLDLDIKVIKLIKLIKLIKIIIAIKLRPTSMRQRPCPDAISHSHPSRIVDCVWFVYRWYDFGEWFNDIRRLQKANDSIACVTECFAHKSASIVI
jgi:hypothetical protein